MRVGDIENDESGGSHGGQQHKHDQEHQRYTPSELNSLVGVIVTRLGKHGDNRLLRSPVRGGADHALADSRRRWLITAETPSPRIVTP